eukprot:1103660-Alexandrium_andersonii.AAC.1
MRKTWRRPQSRTFRVSPNPTAQPLERARTREPSASPGLRSSLMEFRGMMALWCTFNFRWVLVPS